MAKTKLTLSIDKDRIKYLKKKAIDAEYSLSEMMEKTASEVSKNQLRTWKVEAKKSK